MPTDNAIKYWTDWATSIAESRLSPPQAEEAKSVFALAIAGSLSAEWRDRAEAGWQPIETAPKDETQVLLYIPGHPYASVFVGVWVEREFEPEGVWYTFGDSCSGQVNRQPTHWQTLPPVPSATEGEDNG